MEFFTDEFVSLLNEVTINAEINAITIGPFSLEIAIWDRVRIQSMEDISFSLDDVKHIWDPFEDTPKRAVPVGKLLQQKVTCFELVSPRRLQMKFASGDFAEFRLEDGTGERMIFDFGKKEGALYWEIF